MLGFPPPSLYSSRPCFSGTSCHASPPASMQNGLLVTCLGCCPFWVPVMGPGSELSGCLVTALSCNFSYCLFMGKNPKYLSAHLARLFPVRIKISGIQSSLRWAVKSMQVQGFLLFVPDCCELLYDSRPRFSALVRQKKQLWIGKLLFDICKACWEG